MTANGIRADVTGVAKFPRGSVVKSATELSGALRLSYRVFQAVEHCVRFVHKLVRKTDKIFSNKKTESRSLIINPVIIPTSTTDTTGGASGKSRSLYYHHLLSGTRA